EAPEAVVSRLPQYVRALGRLLEEGTEVISSQQLGERIQVTPAQIRSDLGHFDGFGRASRGYNVNHLLGELKQILDLNTTWNMALLGVGRLGQAILGYPGFTAEGFHLVAAFDNNPTVVGQQVEGVTVRPIEELDEVVREQDISIAIVAVPREHAQKVIDRLIECGVRAILNYAPIIPQVQQGMKICNIDPVLALQSMTYYLTDRDSQ
ncbi:MAG: redox-sensing transcriptional repressor Rex, partial [Dehalococcoidia bacterium]